jgi:hypothetical protein
MTSSLSPNRLQRLSVMLKHNYHNIVQHQHLQRQPLKNEVGSLEVSKLSEEDGDLSDLIDDDDEWNAVLSDFSDDDDDDLDKGEVY